MSEEEGERGGGDIKREDGGEGYMNGQGVIARNVHPANSKSSRSQQGTQRAGRRPERAPAQERAEARRAKAMEHRGCVV